MSGLLLTLTGCSQETTDEWQRLGLPEPASDRAEYTADLWIGSWTAALIIGAFVWGLILWTSFHYRRRHDEELPTQVRYNLPIEVLYTIAPIIVVAVLFFYTVEKQNAVTEVIDDPDHDVLVTGQQWSWTFTYRDEEALGGDTDVYELGTPATIPELWLVEDQSVTFELNSPDVIHSFWVPAFLYKLDVIPGRDQSFSLTPTTAGEFEGRCAELCGFQHSRMLFTVKVVDQGAYDAHLLDLEQRGQVGEPEGAVDSEDVEGLETEDGEVTQ
ncbi:MAG: cytochrome c oxidase subunit II [Nocardioidaceae bacterium]